MMQRRAQSLKDLMAVTNILYECGKDMATKYDLHHWDNAYLKTAVIVLVCLLKNKVWVIEDQEMILATYQTKTEAPKLFFEKLAVQPKSSNRGIGSFCLEKIEEEALQSGCSKVVMDVYSKSKHAIQFYFKHGYSKTGDEKTLKYHIIRMEKELQS